MSGKIQISEATYELIRERFDCRKRGAIDIKGKGEMTTWFLEAVKDGSTARPPAEADQLQPRR